MLFNTTLYMLAVETPLLRASIKKTDVVYMRQKTKTCIELDSAKSRVAAYKSKVDPKRWKILTEPIILTGNKQVCSKAYYKLQEIINSCALKEPKSSLHICEAPGGFVQCVCEEFKNIERWYASSLKDGIQFKTENLDMKKGNIINQGNISNSEVRNDFTVKVDLVTGDGAFLEEDHDSLETTNYNIFLHQTEIALKCLNIGGTFVCKFFEGMEINTQMLICVLTNCFESVSIIKPYSSKSTNSERYIVCRGFKTNIDVANTVWETSEPWMNELEEIMDGYASDQIKSLNNLFSVIDRECGKK